MGLSITGNVPTSTRIKFEHSRRLASSGSGRLNWTELHFAHTTHLPSECRLGELGRATIMFLLEVRIFGILKLLNAFCSV